MKSYKVKADVWKYPGFAGWHFVYVGKELSEEIKKKYGGNERGFGSLPVIVTVGGSTWDTSIFPSKREGSYIMAIKASIRKKEGIYDGDNIDYSFKIRDRDI